MISALVENKKLHHGEQKIKENFFNIYKDISKRTNAELYLLLISNNPNLSWK